MKINLLFLTLLVMACREKVDPVKGRQIGQMHAERAMTAFSRDELDTALYYSDLSATYIPADEDMLCMRMQVYMRLHKQDSAIKVLEELVKMNRGERRYYLPLAELYARFKKFEEGNKLLNKVDRWDPDALTYIRLFMGSFVFPEDSLYKQKTSQALFRPILIRSGMELSYGDRAADYQPGKVSLHFRGDYRPVDTVAVLVNNEIIYNEVLMSGSVGVWGECEVDYSKYKELPRITVLLRRRGEAMYFYPVKEMPIALVGHSEYFNSWGVLMTKNKQYYW